MLSIFPVAHTQNTPLAIAYCLGKVARGVLCATGNIDTHYESYTSKLKKGKGKGHPCTATEAVYRPYGP